ncbi:MAG: FprA family A-type flavoprotein [Muribaculaceae bacterium]|nr:FprA family A-type flavoprotein [Muribaculaceae bacterium]
MNIKEITSGIYYCGVNDRVTEKFESLWPLPLGVSYNSYIVKGSEKLALIDTVRIDEFHEFMENVRSIADGRSIDYLVINHMEPDHSGSIPLVLKEYPEMKIVGNSQTIGMVKGFYHIDDDNVFLEVKENDIIDLGGRQLRFHLTPMVHWPETMMCYVPDAKVLFSGDAFGTFGALNGGVVDTDMDTDWYIPEMYRYYSNIVGKYGKFVQRALAKFKGVELDYICSTHGPVWHDRIQEIVSIFDRLSSYTPEPGVTIIYGSMYGNTAEVAEVMASQLASRGVRNIKIHNASHSEMSDMISDAFRYEGLIVGSATYSMRLLPPVETFMNAMETREICNKVFATFGGYTWAKGAVVNKLQEYADRMKMPVVATMMMRQNMDAEAREEAIAVANVVADSLTLK